MAWMRAHWKLIAACAVLFLVGVGVGSAGNEEAASAEPVMQTVTETETDTVSETVTETMDPTEAQVAALEDREAELDQRAGDLRQRARELDERAAAIRRQERIIARSTFGNGVYLVGTDVPPGSYVARRAGSSCYWERASRNGEDIILNHFGGGQARATLNAGELFSTDGCGTWRRG
ncbi:MAG: hypothetical protein ACRDNI_02855 [Gaiellaceae bacterium]